MRCLSKQDETGVGDTKGMASVNTTVQSIKGISSSKEKDSSKVKSLTGSVNASLKFRYNFRYSVLTEGTEYRLLERMKEGFISVNQRVLNTFYLETHESGISCWDRGLSRCVFSTRITKYHPFKLHLEELPIWDGVNRLAALARRASRDQLWAKELHIWVRGMTAQWMGATGSHANSVVPSFISTEQGYLKSTFCKSLLPPALQCYCMNKVGLTSQGHTERRLAGMGLLSLDGSGKYAPTKMPLLKSLMQMASLSLCKAYQKNYRSLPRIASFTGTSNRKDLSTDPTGSCRFVCALIEYSIDCGGTNYAQLYTQLKAEISAGEHYWFTKEEETELQQSSMTLCRQRPVEDILHSCYRVAEKGEGCGLPSFADIFQRLEKINPATMREANPASLA